jgi:hypothetical protein
MVGLLSGLLDAGTDLSHCDLIVGTSAGARTGAQLATGVIREVADGYRNGQFPKSSYPRNGKTSRPRSGGSSARAPIGRR